jgi:single-strand DNA-binding protein
MASLARMTLIGNLGRDAELKYTPKGAAVLEFSIAVNEKWNDASGQQQERTQWFRVSVWGRQGEALKPFLLKGKQVYVEGRFTAREYTDRDGKNRTSLEVKGDTIQLLGGRQSSSDEQYGQPAELEREDPNVSDEDIPF